MRLVFIVAALLVAPFTNAMMEEVVETATYKVTITSNWNEMDHLAVPGPAHFSPVVAVSHNVNYALVPMGGVATEGLESVAELGRTEGVSREIRRAQRMGDVSSFKVTENQFVARQPVQTFEVTVSASHPYLSFVSMIAPSPDWVIGLSSLKLYNVSTGFTDGISGRALYALDAGTENGDKGGNFSLSNQATAPRAAISQLTGPGLDAPFAFVQVERLP